MVDVLQNVRTVEELFDGGCKEVYSGLGKTIRLSYLIDDELIATMCMFCNSVKLSVEFSYSSVGFPNVQIFCKSCDSIRNKNYRALHPLVVCVKDARRLAIKAALPGTESVFQRRSVWDVFNNACALTGKSSNIHADHSIPIAVGHGGTVFGNMIPLDGFLNISKSDNHLYEWFYASRGRFNLPQRRFDDLIDYLAKTNDMTTQEYRKYLDWVFDNPRKIDVESGELVFI